jgi:hypothetical protein
LNCSPAGGLLPCVFAASCKFLASTVRAVITFLLEGLQAHTRDIVCNHRHHLSFRGPASTHTYTILCAIIVKYHSKGMQAHTHTHTQTHTQTRVSVRAHRQHHPHL